MKKLIILLVLSLIFTGCQTEDNNLETDSLQTDSPFEFKELVNSKIGIEKNGEIQINVSNESVMAAFNKFNLDNDLGLTPRSYSLIEKDGKNYLRFYSENNQVSTIALIKGDDLMYSTESTVCTSTACASGGGCIPDGSYCTKCTMENGLPGDCSRKTTGLQHVD